MIILDSNIWIALYHEEDSQHAKAQTLIQKIREPVGIPEYILIEVCTVLTNRLHKSVADLFLDRIQKSENTVILPIEQKLFYELCHFFRTHNFPKLSFIDSCLVYFSQFHTIHTFDKKLASAIQKQVR